MAYEDSMKGPSAITTSITESTGSASADTTSVKLAERWAIVEDPRMMECDYWPPLPAFFLVAVSTSPVGPSMPMFGLHMHVEETHNRDLVKDMFTPQYSSHEGHGSVFFLDCESRLYTQANGSDVFAALPDFHGLGLFGFLRQKDIEHNKYPYVTCYFKTPSGRLEGDYAELGCVVRLLWRNRIRKQVRSIFQYCPIYGEGFDTGTVIVPANEINMPPTCFNITYLAKLAH
ncbi:hypothetical protein B0I35DRAFT_477301 [Stachybotrys elegans]|uniref:Uncharacterized protein n=1 Tax=Stachybotrys elegans TaxID=80388 RepID=A0A8K0SV57_9HYPO|nr:hypothetical protein B0I35DRAFT_477301 [Stachybotrys elegans]